jgi:GNAT superfamily N-acetyltransferase
MTSTEFRASDVPGRVKALEDEVLAGGPVGVLAFADDEPVGWCSVAPRAGYRALERSRVLAPVDDAPVWSLVCFYIPGPWRRRGVAGTLLRGALAYALEHEAPALEAYPAGGGNGQAQPAGGGNGQAQPALESGSYSHMGPRGLFEREGFVDVTPPGRKRSVLRHDLRA